MRLYKLYMLDTSRDILTFINGRNEYADESRYVRDRSLRRGLFHPRHLDIKGLGHLCCGRETALE